MPPWRTMLALLSLCVGLYAAWSVKAQSQQTLYRDKPANIVFILTDDQDLHMNSLAYMPHTQRLISDQVSIWTGKAAHNTNVTDVNPPHGGYPKFVSQKFNEDYLPLWLQVAGYNTYYTGKLFNAHKVTNYDKPFAAGWTGSDFLLDPYTYEYLNATFQRNHDPPVSYEGRYSTDVLASKAYGFINDAIKAEKPFLLTVAPIAPHSNVHILDKNIHGNYSGASAIQSPPVPASRHENLFKDAVVARTPSFNPDSANGAAWIAGLSKQNETNIEYNDEWYRNRLRSLQSVDEMVEGIINRLEASNILDNTYVIFSTDNGYHVGQHRLQPGKQCAYKEDVNIPFVVRGPGVPKKLETGLVTSHTDLAATFLEIAGAAKRTDLDGDAIPLSPDAMAAAVSQRGEHVGVEMWGIIMSEGKYGANLYNNHTYKSLRVIGDGYSLLYTVWCNGEHELYDLLNDSHEIHNIYPRHEDSALPLQPTNFVIDNGFSSPETTELSNVVSRLDALLVVLKTCKGRECTHPWEVLHPKGDVRNLRAALNPLYDDFYGVQKKVYWTQCEQAYIAESEGPSAVDQYMWHEVAA